MSERARVVCVLGTRPEAIKMAPVIARLRDSSWAECVVVSTAQHRELLDSAMSRLGVKPDIDLDSMRSGQSVVELTGRLIPALSGAIDALKPAAVLAQGDTATVFASAVTAYLGRIPFGHVEAGLRTHDLAEPFPEEGFRQMAARVARWHFAPTPGAVANLIGEGIAGAAIHMTGNTGIDALMTVVSQVQGSRTEPADRAKRRVLVTAHRRESFGEPMARIFSALRRLAERYEDIEIVYPVHPNPNVSGMARQMLEGVERIVLCEPLDYFDFVDAMLRSHLILTDSGGIQEEAPAIGKPVLVLRDQTERPEAVAAGAARLVGTDSDEIFEQAARLLDDPAHYKAMVIGSSPYGDGRAAARIAEILRRDLSSQT